MGLKIRLGFWIKKAKLNVKFCKIAIFLGFMVRNYKNILSYKHFILSSVKVDFSTRFARSKLGAIWILLNPLAQVLMYALVLSSLMRAKLPGVDSQFAYAIYLIAGMMMWALFNEIFMRCVDSFTSNANIIKKISFPKICLPIIALLSAIINNLIFITASFLIFFCLGHFVGFSIFYILLLILLTAFLAFGAGLFFGVINVFLRDISQILGILTQFLFWMTPIVYMINILPQNYQGLLYFNPLTAIAKSYHNIILYDKAPEFYALLYPLILGIFMLILGIFVYFKANEEMADAL